MNINNPTTFSAPNLTFGATNSSGTSGALRADDTVNIWAAPTVAFGTAAVVGDAATGIRSNSTLLLYDTTAPTTIAFSDTAATGSQATAARRDHLHGMPASPTSDISCRLTNDAAITVTDGVNKALPFNVETFDTDGMHDTVTNNTRIICKTAGKFLINANYAWGGNASGYRRGRILVGGSTAIAMVQIDSPGANNIRQTISCIYELAVDDYVEIVVDQSSGGDLAISSESLYSPVFSAIRIEG